MNSGTYDASLEPVSAVSTPAAPKASLLRKAVLFPVKLFWGMFFCQSLAGSVFVVGWTYRLVQRCAYKFWYTRSGVQSQLKFADFAASHDLTQAHVHWPNWFLDQTVGQALQSPPELRWSARALKSVRTLTHSLWANFW